MRNRPLCHCLGMTLAAFVGLLLIGCASDTRPNRSEQDLLADRATYFQALGDQSVVVRTALVDRMRREQDQGDSGESGAPATLHVLILSGGGDAGAFGSGFLRGWSTIKSGDLKKPEFDAVTGVSTGALIAPFAFVGDDEAIRRLDEFYRNPKPSWVREHGLLTFLVEERAYYDITGLEEEIRLAVDSSLIERIAAAAEQGRALAVGATNMDFGTQHAFLVSSLAIAARETGDPKMVHEALLASAAIPIAFPAREINGHLYVDGGLTSNILFSGDPESPNGFSAVWRDRYPDRPLPRIRYWVIVNNQMLPPPAVVQPRWSSLGGPTVDTAIRVSTAAALRELSLLVRIQRAAGIDTEWRWVCIPEDWRPPKKEFFNRETMRNLSDLGYRMGSDPSSWRTVPLE